MANNNHIALLCTIHPASSEKQAKILSLLRKGAREYYRRPEARCTTWSYFTPFPPPKNANANPRPPLVIAGLEIYSQKAALQRQVDDPGFFQPYHETVKREELYGRDEELVAWYLAGGFVARGESAPPFGGNLVSLTRFVGEREEVLRALEDFVPFVRDKEPGVLTYAAFKRPKAPREVLLFVRYRDLKALKSHGSAPEHTAAVKEITKHIVNDMVKDSTLWQEVEDSFVSTQDGGPSTLKL